ncbi:single-stranded DNA-binding protein [Vibrio phage 2.275.O._10N.286.54.E11]|nr:single-stranded DNA-binding protein [Vibrio phage 2.275.O._10N.286.54.E11]
MALSLAEIRAKLQAQEDKAANPGQGFNNNEPNAFLAHWNIPDGVPLNLRFLPDADENNDYFWKERDMINLWFNGIKGGDNKKVKVVVPCNEMWGPTGSCPVLKEVREWYKAGDSALEERAREYWKKKSYLMQCIIAPDSCEVEKDNAPENPIRRVMLNKGLFNKVKSILLNPRVEYMPTEYEHGRDFSIIKGKQGQFANYDQSQWDMYERPLDTSELEAIETHGLFNLDDFMPKQPSEEHLQAIAEMFEASVNEEPYDPDRWSQYYRPAGVQAPQGSSTPKEAQKVEDVAPKETPKVEDTPTAPTQTTTAPAKKSSTSDLLAKLKAAKGE